MIADPSDGICDDAVYHIAYPNVEIGTDTDAADHRSIGPN